MNQRVLVIEDDEMIRESLMELLEDHGYQTDGAGHGREALDKLLAPTTAPPCLIVLDLMMPIMDGREFRRQQLADPALSQIPVVIMSAYRDFEQLADELAPVGMFRKPLKVQELLDVVDKFCCSRTS